MITKIKKILNVGQFVYYENNEGLELRKLSLIYSQNGRGKTTLAEIFRSLGNNETSLVTCKNTLGDDGFAKNQYVELEVDSGKQVILDVNGWSGKPDDLDIEVFDSHFVDQSVYMGNRAEKDQTADLFTFFFFGSNIVELKNNYDQLKIDATEALKKYQDEGEKLANKLDGSFKIDEFQTLKMPENIDEQITTKKVKVNTIRNARNIKNLPLLSIVSLPLLSENNLKTILYYGVDQFAEDTGQEVSKEITQRMKTRDVGWVDQGYDRLQKNDEGVLENNQDCPFCGQSLDAEKAQEWLTIYKNYFSQAYKNHRQTLDVNCQSLLNDIEKEKIATLLRTIANNTALTKRWGENDFKQSLPIINTEEIEQLLLAILQLTKQLLGSKKTDPLIEMQIGEELAEQLDRIKPFSDSIDEYNTAVERLNNKLGEFKEKVSIGSLEEEEKKLKKLEITKQRSSTKMNKLCEECKRLKAFREEKVDKREKAKELFDSSKKKLPIEFADKANKYIDILIPNNHYRISPHDSKIDLRGREASLNWVLTFRGKNINSKNEGKGTSLNFRDVLSDGDRRSLALAFFLAKVSSDPAGKVIVLDDPVTSLDRHRDEKLVKIIMSLLRDNDSPLEQVILLSHNPFFLERVYETNKKSNQFQNKLLKIHWNNSGSTVGKYSLSEDTTPSLMKYYFLLSDYLNGNESDSRKIASTIRTIIEKAYNTRYIDRPDTDYSGIAPRLIKDYNVDVETSNIAYFVNNSHHENRLDDGIDDNRLKLAVEETLKLVDKIFRRTTS